eukprot:3671527-Rhodomonas_salina.1
MKGRGHSWRGAVRCRERSHRGVTRSHEGREGLREVTRGHEGSRFGWRRGGRGRAAAASASPSPRRSRTGTASLVTSQRLWSRPSVFGHTTESLVTSQGIGSRLRFAAVITPSRAISASPSLCSCNAVTCNAVT